MDRGSRLRGCDAETVGWYLPTFQKNEVTYLSVTAVEAPNLACFVLVYLLVGFVCFRDDAASNCELVEFVSVTVVTCLVAVTERTAVWPHPLPLVPHSLSPSILTYRSQAEAAVPQGLQRRNFEKR